MGERTPPGPVSEPVHILASASPFQHLPAEQLAALAQVLTRQEVPAGTAIVEQGAPGDAAFLVWSGAVAIESSGRTLAEGLGPGTFFGELALLSEEPRNASVIATEPTVLLRLGRAAFDRWLEADATVRSVVGQLAEVRARPRRRADVQVQARETVEGQPIYVLHDPRPQYFQLSARGHFLFERMDGEHTIADLTKAQLETFGEFAPHRVSDLVGRLAAAGFVDMPRVVDRDARVGPLGWLRAALTARWPLANADALSDRLHRALRPLFVPALGYLAGGLAIFGLVAFVVLGVRGEVFDAPIGAGGLACVYGLAALGWALHEIGHAMTVKHYGRRVGAAGIGWLWVAPIVWVDTSDMWLEPTRARVRVGLAGICVDAVFGGAASLLAWGSAGPAQAVLWSVAGLSFLSVLANLNPLLELDGYHVLSDLTERPHLRRDSLTWLASLGLTAAAPRRHRLEAGYAIAAVGYLIGAAALVLVAGPPALLAAFRTVFGSTGTYGVSLAWALCIGAAAALLLGLGAELARLRADWRAASA